MRILRRIGKLKTSEKTLLKELYLEYKPVLYNAVFKISKDSKAAEDIVHNVFIKVSDKLNEIEDPIELKKWMMTSAKNEAFDYYNYNKKSIASENIDQVDYNYKNEKRPEEYPEDYIEKIVFGKIKFPKTAKNLSSTPIPDLAINVRVLQPVARPCKCDQMAVVN
ncbi:RNA polymerase sigma factor [Natranaerofaba carboxydovora]|uniref:RNA polymerase sigma factor n=1 Tax=Natranaerofaba carboxydovora TaxID=2742683 RepID=UPI001F1477EE|nr:sigma-70 family RNA polymerase sigma factor [Natranaerofaba carboxydovora]UMZ72975.1 Sigma-70 region 2 [Natranaerofaba carboxydovora]